MKKNVLIIILILVGVAGLVALYFPITKTVKIDPLLTSGISGTVTLGPTCPVMRIPPDPQCADKPYQTSIDIFTAGGSNPKQIGKVITDSSGKYSIKLPAGVYTLKPAGGSVLPRCESKNVTVTANTITEADLSCDSGIR